MPACYAHYRFGTETLHLLPEKAQGSVKRCRRIYDVGVHGPDIFFYHNPFSKNATVELGYRFHRYTGKEFFTRTARKVRMHPTDRSVAYLFGLLSHYALDSCCHPLIVSWDEAGICPHVATESEFDRCLLQMDGRMPAHRQDLSRHLRVGPKDYPVIGEVYGVSSLRVAKSCENFKYYTRLLCPTGKVSRAIVEKGIRLAPGMQDFLIPGSPDLRCSHLDGELLEQYQKAKEIFPELARQLCGLLDSGTPLGEEFAPVFG